MYDIHYLISTANGNVSEKQIFVSGYQEATEMIEKIKSTGYEVLLNKMCSGCQRLFNGCAGEVNHVYSGCIYK